MVLSVAPVTLWFARGKRDNIGYLTLQDLDGIAVTHKDVTFKRMLALSGSKSQYNTEWIRGISPIPFGKHFLLLKPRQLQMTPGGLFWPIFSSAKDTSLILGPQGQVRQHIGLHFDNLNPGSAGCVVLPYEDGRAVAKRRADTLFSYLKTLKDYQCIKFNVI
jgi:hypothetical protein